jgi:hypothetical protein
MQALQSEAAMTVYARCAGVFCDKSCGATGGEQCRLTVSLAAADAASKSETAAVLIPCTRGTTFMNSPIINMVERIEATARQLRYFVLMYQSCRDGLGFGPAGRWRSFRFACSMCLSAQGGQK